MLERTSRALAGFGNGLAAFMDGFFRLLGRPGKWLQDFLNGVWLGHSLHAVVVDVVVGGSTVAVLLDLLALLGVGDLETATRWALGLAWLAGIGAIVTGLTDFKDTVQGDERNVTTLHGTVNFVGNVGFGVSLFMRLGGNVEAARWVLFASYLVISVGAYIGGHVVYKHGYMVNRNAWTRGKRAREFIAVLPVGELPEATPTKASLGTTALVLVRRGDVVHALKDTCSHAGGPLHEGVLRDDAIACPWHGSVFALRDGAVRHGPSQHRQVSYRARIAGEQVEVQGPYD
jgi:nitrite reductase/ring-hydroxylating ferredoxin subunit